MHVYSKNPYHKQLSPETAIIAFDFHGVVVHQDMANLISELGKIVWNADNRGSLFKDAFGILKDSWRLKKEKDVFDDVLDELVRLHPSLAPHASRIHNVVNSHTPSKDMIAIINVLKKRGYKIYMASNISPKALETMRAKEPEVIGLFDAIYTAHNKKMYEDGVYAHEVKPHPAFYKGFRAFIQDVSPADAQKTIIFVDDKQKNIDGALKADKNLIGIRFDSIKEFKRELRKRGIIRKIRRNGVTSKNGGVIL